MLDSNQAPPEDTVDSEVKLGLERQAIDFQKQFEASSPLMCNFRQKLEDCGSHDEMGATRNGSTSSNVLRCFGRNKERI